MILNFINELSMLFIISFLLNGLIFYTVKSGLLGNDLKDKLNIVLEKKIHLITLISFFLFLSLSLYLQIKNIYLDNKEVEVKAIINNTEVIVSGPLVISMFHTLGSAGVFALGTRLAAGLLANKPLNFLPKLGIITSVGAGFTVSYRLISNSILVPSTGSAIIRTGPIEVKLENISLNESQIKYYKRFLEQNNNLSINSSQLNVSNDSLNGNIKIVIDGNKEASSKVISEIEKLDPNWKDKFSINSPLENGDVINQILIDNLTNNFLLHIIILYLLTVLIFIIFCKFNLNLQNQLLKIQSLPFGNLIHKILSKIISLWQISSNIWIYFILFALFIFNLTATYSIYQILVYLKSI
jgi:hypothetical protein